jgi:hypothetical protein
MGDKPHFCQEYLLPNLYLLTILDNLYITFDTLQATTDSVETVCYYVGITLK